MKSFCQPLAALRQVCHGRIWGLRQDVLEYNLHEVMQHPPKEIFAAVVVDEFGQEFLRLRGWLRAFA
eukprot:3126681-Lingulodinium_polyedra.AAC.1